METKPQGIEDVLKVNVLKWKQTVLEQLELKLSGLKDDALVSSTTLDKKEQMKYLNIALFHLWYDLKGKSDAYHTTQNTTDKQTKEEQYNQ